MTTVVPFSPREREKKPPPSAADPAPSPTYAELAVTSNYSFLRGASHPEEMVLQAEYLGIAGIAVADRNTVAGVVRGWTQLENLREKRKERKEPAPKLKYVAGCRLAFRDGAPDVLAWPTDRAAWGRLCRLLTLGNRRAPKGECHLDLADLMEWGSGIILGVMPGAHIDEPLRAALTKLAAAFPGDVRLMANCTYAGEDELRLAALARLAAGSGVPLMATNDVHYHHPDRRPLQDVVTCVREKTTLAAAGYRLAANAERHLKPPEEMARLFRRYPEALAETQRVLARITFDLGELHYLYPEESTGGFGTPDAALAHFALEGAKFRYPDGIPDRVRTKLAEELKIIAGRQYAPYFLTVHDIVRFARDPKNNILCQGRGSAANSVVCYCLGITEVDPAHANLLFERFISPNRNEPPDIDVDFEHERREEVMQYIYRKYTRERAGIAATVITYRTRSAIRDVGKVFGLSEDTVGALASTTWGWSSDGVLDEDVTRAGLDPAERTLKMVLELCRELIGFPRHLSQHVGGFVMTNDRLDETVPVMNAAMEDRTHVEWDKDDLDALHMMKVDVLALGMLSCIRRALDFIADKYGTRYTLDTIPKEDGAVYEMLGRADTVGVFQVESRAQMSMLPRLKPLEFYDLVIEVAIVRPGPIQGGMVHPYLKRREGSEDVEYPSPSPQHGDKDELEKILKRTLGVPLFQEQAMQIAMDAAKFTAAEADGLRRAMATFRRNGTIGNYRDLMIGRMTERGYTQEFAERCFRQIEGFGDYGFPESHAASFALLVYASAWIKVHYPDVFAAALLNAQPMGFYAPAQIVRDAERHGVIVLPPDVNHSDWDCTLEPVPTDHRGGELHPRHITMANAIRTRCAVRLGLRQIKSVREDDVTKTLMPLRHRGYDSVRDLWLRTGLARAAIEHLADGDAFRSLGLDRRDALWAARGEGALKAKDRLPLFDVAAYADIRKEPDFGLPPMLPGEHVVHDYRYLSLSLKAHPLSFLRAELADRRIVPAAVLRDLPSGRRVTVSGLVITRQRPGTAKGVIFMTLEDETDIANIIVWPKTYERYRPVVLGSRLVSVTGKVQNAKGVVHVVAEQIDDLTPLLGRLSADASDLSALARADEVTRPGDDQRGAHRHPRNVRFFQDGDQAKATHAVMPKGRNFH